MTNAAKHTPTPWHVTEYTKEVNPRGDRQRFATIRSGEDYWIADGLPLDCKYGGDAAFICKAVNCHEELVEALGSVPLGALTPKQADEIIALLAKAQA